MTDISLKTVGIEKRFGGVQALKDGSITITSGEVLALVGANGSGKSTLTKIITGVLAKDSGSILFNGNEVEFHNPMAAQKAGITAVYQELSLVPSLTVAQNIWLAHEPVTKFGSIDEKQMIDLTDDLLDNFKGTYQTSLHPEAYVKDLPPDERQIVEILKALSRDPDILILDEATASLDNQQVHCLFNLIQQMKIKNKGLVFVSHRMDEIFRFTNRAIVLRNGFTVGEKNIDETDEDEIVQMMIGSKEGLLKYFHVNKDLRETEIALDVSNLENEKLSGVNFTIRTGELVGLGGLRGQGQSTLLHTLFGNFDYRGEIYFFNKLLKFQHPEDAMANGIALIPGDRATEGLLLIRSILENLHLPNWEAYGRPLLKINKAKVEADRVSKQLNLVMESLESPVNSLSGGNAQKVVIGKWLLRSPKLLLLDDPTKGVDVGTKAEFYKLLGELSNSGTTILFYSSDDQELLDLCPRVLVMQDGIIKADLFGKKLTETNLVAASMGGSLTNSFVGEVISNAE